MADTVGRIAQITNTSVATHTVYTVGTGKALIFKPQFLGQANGGAVSTFKMTVNGMDLFQSGNITAGYYFWSSSAAIIKNASGFPNGQTLADTIAPAFASAGFGGWYASAGDVIAVTIGSNALQSLYCALVGTLVDA